jgi:hypothetical protein
MSKGNGRFAIMRDLQDHLIAGRISALDVGIYTIIHWQTDFRTGLWWGSAPKVHATAPRGMSLRDVQRSMETLTAIGFLKPFRKHGQRGNCPVLLNKYLPLSGALKGMRLNAALSDDWRHPKYEPCALTDAQSDAQAAPIQYAVSSMQDENPSPRTVKPPSEEAVALASLLRERIVQNNPTARTSEGQPIRWAREADVMMRRDNRSPEQIRQLIEWSQQDEFWKTNILSMGKLREKFDQLTVRRSTTPQKGSNNGKATVGDNARITLETMRVAAAKPS